MDRDINQWTGSGHATNVKHSFSKDGNKKLVMFSVECKEKYRNRDGEIKSWSNRISINWEPVEDEVELSDGDYVFVSGRIKVSSKEYNGERKYFTNIAAETVQRLHSSSEIHSSEIPSLKQEDIPF